MKKLSKLQQEAVDKLKKGYIIVKAFYTKDTYIYLSNKGTEEKLNTSTFNALSHSKIIKYIGMTTGGVTRHYFKLNEEYESTVNRGILVPGT